LQQAVGLILLRTGFWEHSVEDDIFTYFSLKSEYFLHTFSKINIRQKVKTEEKISVELEMVAER
jgi:hypothetical protein